MRTLPSGSDDDLVPRAHPRLTPPRAGVMIRAMKLRGRAHKVIRGQAGRLEPIEPASRIQASDRLDPTPGGRLWSGAGDYDHARESIGGRELATSSAEHIDADRAGWSRSHRCLPPAEC
jgi:hypothetical protein